MHDTKMKFSVYGRFQLEVAREGGVWVVYRLAPGKRIRADDLAIPSSVSSDEIGTYLDDMFHELSRPGRSVERIP
jgi:hypothetical protein